MRDSLTDLASRVQSLEATVEHLPTKAEAQKFKTRLKVSLACMAVTVFAASVSGALAIWSVVSQILF